MADILLLCLAIGFIILGMVGSFLPILPGPITSWFGLLLAQLTDAIPNSTYMLVITLIIAIGIWAIDYIIPPLATKKFGGSKYGVIGTSIGLVIGFILPIPGGLIIGAFIGAFVGEISNKMNFKVAIKAAIGSLIGFVTSTILKFSVALIYSLIFANMVWKNSAAIFGI
jgi:uncharacterized protein YqgC (DUF456 family)